MLSLYSATENTAAKLAAETDHGGSRAGGGGLGEGGGVIGNGGVLSNSAKIGVGSVAVRAVRSHPIIVAMRCPSSVFSSVPRNCAVSRSLEAVGRCQARRGATRGA